MRKWSLLPAETAKACSLDSVWARRPDWRLYYLLRCYYYITALIIFSTFAKFKQWIMDEPRPAKDMDFHGLTSLCLTLGPCNIGLAMEEPGGWYNCNFLYTQWHSGSTPISWLENKFQLALDSNMYALRDDMRPMQTSARSACRAQEEEKRKAGVERHKMMIAFVSRCFKKQL